MITSDMKISHLLNEYPQALDVLLELSSDFHKLKNPVLRRFLAPRVTIAQASKIGGVPLDHLLTALNHACGFEHLPHHHEANDEAFVATPQPDALKAIPGSNYVELDVREDIRQNSDPFKKIMSAVKNIQPNQVLHLINIFEPIPLYDVLGHRGFLHWTDNRDGIWHIYFYHGHEKHPSLPIEQPERELLASNVEYMELDVRGLEPPEPMMKILAALPMIDAGKHLLVHHHREPKMLYEKLEERGYEWETTKEAEDHYTIMIRERVQR